MPWKMILFLILLVIIGVFAAFNLDNRSTVSLGVVVFRDVPIFLSLLLAFVAGALVMIPFLYGSRRKRLRQRGEAARGDRRVPDDRFPGEGPEVDSTAIERKR